MRAHVLALGAVGILAAAAPLLAHHSWPVDFSREVTVKGTVMEYSWAKDSLRMGDVITGTGYRFADGQRILRLQKIVMPDGKVMQLYAADSVLGARTIMPSRAREPRQV
jgi:hypothetical protein